MRTLSTLAPKHQDLYNGDYKTVISQLEWSLKLLVEYVGDILPSKIFLELSIFILSIRISQYNYLYRRGGNQFQYVGQYTSYFMRIE